MELSWILGVQKLYFRSGGSSSSMTEAKQDMLPDSTQGETPDQKKGTKRKGSKDGKKKKKIAKKKSKVTGKGKTKSNPASDVDSDLDLSKEKQPLEFYLNDRECLLEEAFKAVKGLQLSNMVPDILKYVPLDELKKLCLNQLEGMSRKRIKHIIQGTEMLSSSDSDESAPEDDAGAVTLTTVSPGGDGTVKVKEEKKDEDDMETGVDSTVKPATQPHVDSQRAEEGTKADDIDGVPVEIDVNLEDLAFGRPKTQSGSIKAKPSTGNTSTKPSKDTSKAKTKGSCEKPCEQVSSSHQTSRSRSPRRRRRSLTSRSRSRERFSRSRSRSWSRRRSWSRSRSRSRSWSRSWSRSRTRSRSRSRSPGVKETKDQAPMSPSPPPPAPHIEAIQMSFPRPPTPTGSLSSGEIREILELESDEEDDEDDGDVEEEEDSKQKEEAMRRKLEGLVGCREGLDDMAAGKVAGVSGTCKGAPADGNASMEVQHLVDAADCITLVSQENVVAGEEGMSSKTTSNVAGVHHDEVSNENDGGDEHTDVDDEDTVDSDDDSDDESDDNSEDDDEDIDFSSLDLGVDITKAAGQPSQLALARASMKPPSTSNPKDEKKDSGSGEAQLEVLELELRARAIRSLMHKCLKDDETS